MKSLVPEMTASAKTLYSSPQGRRSLLYLIVPRTRRHFTPAQIATLADTDEARSRTSKKDPAVRQQEVRVGASEPLFEWLQSDCEKVVRDPGGSLVAAELFLFGDGGELLLDSGPSVEVSPRFSDKSVAIEHLVKLVSQSYPSPDPSNPHPIDLPHTSRLYKTLLQGGHFNHTTKQVEEASSWDAPAFATQFVDLVGKEAILNLCTKGQKNGTFVVAELCGALCRGTSNSVGEARTRVKEWFDKSTRKEIENGDAKGKTVLLEKVSFL